MPTKVGDVKNGEHIDMASMTERSKAIDGGEKRKGSGMSGGGGGGGTDEQWAWEDNDDELPPASRGPLVWIEAVQEAVLARIRANAFLLKRVLLLAIVLAFHAVLVIALIRDLDRASNLLLVTCLCWLYVLGRTIVLPCLQRLNQFMHFDKHTRRLARSIGANQLLKALFYFLAVALPIVFVVVDTAGNRERLSGLMALAFFILYMTCLSNKPTKINWRPVLWGFLLQFIFGLIVLKWEWGARKFNELSQTALAFLDLTKNGTDFTYGFLSSPPNICGMEPVFAFQAIQTIIYLGAVIAALYFYGIVGAVLKRMARLMQLTLGTTATESLNACGCVLLGNAESPMLIRPYIQRMTASELHAIMTTGFSCIAGTVFAAFINFGACPRYLLSAAIMSAPGSLACSKLLYPETQKSHVKRVDDLELPPSEESNLMEAITNGTLLSVRLVTACVANLVSFMAIAALLNALVGYFGALVGHPDWSLEMMFSYLFLPVAYMMGVTHSIQEAMIVARLIGVKIVINDFVAYQRLSWVLNQNLLTPRTAMIATYALCSFSEFIAAGVQLVVLSEMAPSRRSLISRLVLRALMAGCISSFMSASIAGILIDQPSLCQPRYSSKADCFDPDTNRMLMKQFFGDNFLNFTGIGGNFTGGAHSEL